MALTDLQIRKATLPLGKKRIKMSDGRGLYLLINRSGKYWRYDFKINNKRKTYSFGVYPVIPLAGRTGHDGIYIKGARDLVIEIKQLIKRGVDPCLLKQESKRQALIEQQTIVEQKAIDSNTFEKIARDWHNTKKDNWNPKHATTILRRFENHVFPNIGEIPVVELNKTQVAVVIKSIVAHGTIEMATRIGQIIRQVLEYACDMGLIELVPMGNIKNIIPARKVKPMPALMDSKRTGELLRAIHSYQGSFVVCQALKVLPLLAARSGEFRAAEWNEFDLESALWTIPAAHRKLTKIQKEDVNNIHLIPLSTQAVSLLKELRLFTGQGKYVFPSVRGDSRPMSENTINAALHGMGFKGEVVGHGFRSMFSTYLNQEGFNPDAIERQLAHREKNEVRAAYNRAEYMAERNKMMQHWADYICDLRANKI